MKTKAKIGYQLDEKEVKTAIYDYFVKIGINKIFSEENIFIFGASDDNGEVYNLEVVLTIIEES